MSEGKIVFEGESEKNKQLIIRYPKASDAKIMWEYINTLSKERTFISFQGEEITLEEETNFLNNSLRKINEGKTVTLLVIIDNKIVGISEINLRGRIEKHCGEFGISLAKDFRGEGIGTLLMGKVIEEATKNIPELEIITLGVFANNPIAKSMYEKFGFIEYGRLPKGIKLENGYQDHIFMYKAVKDIT